MSAGELRAIRAIVLGLQNQARRQVHESYRILEGLTTLDQLLTEMLAAEGVARRDPDDPGPTSAA